MKKIGVIVKRGVPEAVRSVKKLLQCVDKKDVTFFIEKETASALKIKGYRKNEIVSKAEIIIVFGGDGTLLNVARLIGDKGLPILGVNLGGLGFITEVSKDEICKAVTKVIFSGQYRYEERIMLSADVYRKGKKITGHTALNDVVINKGAIARMVELEICVNNQYVTDFRADGLIVSTPTGSTAYSLSAGGPILYPTLESFVMTPICPHTLANRPIVLPDNFTIAVNVRNSEDIYLTLDGQEGIPLMNDDRIMIRKADFKAKFLLIQERDYFQVLRTKLNWGKQKKTVNGK